MAHHFELGRNRLVLDRVALPAHMRTYVSFFRCVRAVWKGAHGKKSAPDQKIVAKALCALCLRAIRKPVVVLASHVIPGATVPADVVAKRGNGPHAVDEFKLANLIEKSRTDVPVHVPFARLSRANGLCKRKEFLSFPHGPSM